jgi:hypothetical protein
MRATQNKAEDPARRKKCSNPLDRLDIVRREVKEGKSRREIAEELGCNEKTVRRDLKKLDLPPKQLAAIEAGDSAEKYLSQALLRETGVDWSARNKIARRRREDEKSGKHSRPLAQALLSWLSSKELTDHNTELVLGDAIRRSKPLSDGQRPAESGRFAEVVAPLERDPDPDRRLTSPEPDFLEQCATELLRGLLRVEPVQAIRQSALKIAITSVRGRGHWMDKLGTPQTKVDRERRRNLRGGK